MTITAEQLAERDFSYCQAFYREPHATHVFLVGTYRKREAETRAWEYARKTWGEPARVIVYPRNYVAKARRLLDAGLHD